MISFRTARAMHTPTDLRTANLAQRKNLLRDAPLRDLDDLIPVLVKRARDAAIASRKAEEELAEALLAKQEKSTCCGDASHGCCNG